jgi:hypothetical protein
MRTFFLITAIFISLFFFISCNQEVEKEYYETGELYRIKKKLNNDETKESVYFKNGQIAREGIKYNDSIKEGIWKTYYIDGTLREELIYSKNKFVKEIIRYPIKLDFKDNPSEFKVGTPYLFRVLGASLSPIEIHKKLGSRAIRGDEKNYTFEITPQEIGNYSITIILKHFDENIKNDTLLFPIKVVE